ncbi:MAG: GIY-YIG nuclease family protein [FCB group bacterium]|jgi:Uri superfamily endonuclease
MNSGSYQIFIKLKKDSIIKIGALGEFNFKKGIYIYTGSAMRNLSQRIERHKRKHLKKTWWHIDYLLACVNAEIIDIKIYPSVVREECKRNQKLLKKKDTFIPVPGFGSSDCKVCKTHLVGIK